MPYSSSYLGVPQGTPLSGPSWGLKGSQVSLGQGPPSPALRSPPGRLTLGAPDLCLNASLGLPHPWPLGDCPPPRLAGTPSLSGSPAQGQGQERGTWNLPDSIFRLRPRARAWRPPSGGRGPWRRGQLSGGGEELPLVHIISGDSGAQGSLGPRRSPPPTCLQPRSLPGHP